MLFTSFRPALRTALIECPTGSGCSCSSRAVLTGTRAFSASTRASAKTGDCPTGQGCGCNTTSSARPSVISGDCSMGSGCGCGTSHSRSFSSQAGLFSSRPSLKSPVTSALSVRGFASFARPSFVPGDCPTGQGCGCGSSSTSNSVRATIVPADCPVGSGCGCEN